MNIRFKIFILMISLVPLLLSAKNDPVYSHDPGDLISSVKRSIAITEQYNEHWESVFSSKSFSDLEKLSFSDRYYYLNRYSFTKYADLFLRAESITKFPVKTVFDTQYLDLFKLFGSLIVKFDDMIDFGAFKWGFAFSSVSSRYGMNKTITLSNTGSFYLNSLESPATLDTIETKEFMYNQIFDDLIVLTNLFRPFGYLHLGLLMNRQIDPGLDGIIGSDDDAISNQYHRLFVSTSLFNLLSLNGGINSKESKTEYFSTAVDIFPLLDALEILKNKTIFPDLKLGYNYLNQKSFFKPDLHTLFIDATFSYYTSIYFKGRIEAFIKGKDSVESKYVLKQAYGELGFDILTMGNFVGTFVYPDKVYEKRSQNPVFTAYAMIYYSYLVDSRLTLFGVAEPVEKGFSGVGLKINVISSVVCGSLELKYTQGHSPKIYNLIEAYNRNMYEASLQLSY